MTSTSDLMTALIAATPPTLMAVVVFFQGRKNTVLVEKNTAITEKIADETEEIKQSTNGNLSLVKTDLAKANGRIEELQKLVSSLIADRKTPSTEPKPEEPNKGDV